MPQWTPEQRLARWDKYIFTTVPIKVYDPDTRTSHVETRRLIVNRGQKEVASRYNAELKVLEHGGSGRGLKTFPYDALTGIDVTNVPKDVADRMMRDLESGKVSMVSKKRFRLSKDTNDVRLFIRSQDQERYSKEAFESP